MLLKNEVLDAIIRGEVSVVFRVWKRPTVKTGGMLTTRKGILMIDKVERINRSDVTGKDMKDARLDSREDLPKIGREGHFYKITLHYHGADPRVALRDNVDRKELDIVCGKLTKMGGWTVRYLRLIHDRPNVHAQTLADALGLGKAKFKGRVRRLKGFGLTESLRPGYRISARGKKVLELLEQNPP